MNSILKTSIIDDRDGKLQTITSGLSTVIISIFERDSLKKYLDSDNSDRPGNYILFNENNRGNDISLYIGETENVGNRLKQHDKAIKKNFWTKTIVMQETSGTLNKAHYKYLEYYLYQLAIESKNSLVVNSVIPTKSSLSECDVFIANNFLETVRNMLSVFNYKFLEQSTIFDPEIDKSIYFIKNHGIESKIKVKDRNNIILLPQSTGLLFGNTDEFLSMDKYKKRLLENGTISVIEETNLFIVNKDIEFDSENEAYTFVTLDTHTEGMYAWYNIDGLSMYDTFFRGDNEK